MTTKPISVTPDMSLEESAALMEKYHVGALVVKDNGQSVGIITEQDIVRKAIAKGINPHDKKIKDMMEENLIVIEPEADIHDALIKMRDMNIRHLPVVKDDQMIGLLTLKDVLKIQPSLFDLLVEKFEIREEERKPINRIIPNEGICQECGEYSEVVKNKKDVMLCENCRKS